MPDFYTVVTDTGLQALGASTQGQSFSLTQAVVGDGNGLAVIPNKGMTTLVNEVWRGEVAGIKVDPNDSNTRIFEFAIPADTGGFTIREVGLLDENGKLFCIGNFPDTEKPVAADGSMRDLVVRLPLHFENADVVNLVIDTAVILASKQDVLDHNADPQAHRFATTAATGFVRLATDEEHVAHQHKTVAATPWGVWKLLESVKSDDVDLGSSLRLATTKGVKTAHDAGTRQASETQRGQAEVATQAEVDAGTDNARFVTPKKLLDLLTRKFLGLAGGAMSGHLNFKSGAWLSMENGNHWITNNDGLGNFNIRIGHDHAEKHTSSGGAVHLEFSHEDTVPSFNIHMTPTGTDNVVGATANFSENYTFEKGGKLAFNGNRFFGKHFLPAWTDVTNKPAVSDSVTSSSSSLATSKAVKTVNDSLNAHKAASDPHGTIPDGGETGQVLIKQADGGIEWGTVAGVPVGELCFSTNGAALPGTIPVNVKQKVLCSAFPQLFEWMKDGTYLTNEAAWDAEAAAQDGTCGKYCWDGGEHFILPCYTRYFAAAYGTKAVGDWDGDAIRNITGEMRRAFRGTGAATTFSGAVTGADFGDRESSGVGDAEYTGFIFDASKVVPTAEENRPKTSYVLPCIKAFDVPINAAHVDMLALAQQVAAINGNKADRTEVPAVAVVSGAIGESQNIPLPSGYTEGQCRFFWAVGLVQLNTSDDYGRNGTTRYIPTFTNSNTRFSTGHYIVVGVK